MSPHKYIPAGASDPRCQQVRSTGRWSSAPCGEGPHSEVHHHRPLVFKNTTQGDVPGWSVSCTCRPLVLLNWEVAHGGDVWTTWLAESQHEAFTRAMQHAVTNHAEVTRG